MQGRRKFWKSGREYALAVMCCGGHNLPLLPSWDRVTDPSKSEGGRAIAPPLLASRPDCHVSCCRYILLIWSSVSVDYYIESKSEPMQLKFQSIELLLYVSTGCTSKKNNYLCQTSCFSQYVSHNAMVQWVDIFFITEDLHFDKQCIYNL